MGKKIDNKKAKPAIKSDKKKIPRQNTMEQTAAEGMEFLKSIDTVIKRKKEEKKKQLEKEISAKKVKKSSIKKAPAAKPAPKASIPVKKAAAAVKVASSSKKDVKVSKVAKPVKGKKPDTIAAASAPVVTAPVVNVEQPKKISTYPSLIEKDCTSCSNIASTEVIENKKLGYQIIKKSLKGQPKAEEGKSDKKKAKILRTKTGDKLAAGMVDIVFCCDTTSSMSSYLNQCKSTVQEIIKKILDKTSGEGISVKFGFVAYRDHPPQDTSYLTCSYDLTSEDEIKVFIESLAAYGGGDTPEAVMDGLYVSAKHMSWRDSTHIPSLRYIFHIADAPAHGKEYYDSWGSSNNGCLCGLDINKVSHIINMKQIHYRFISADNMSSTKKMADIFKQKIVDYDECSISKATEMDIKISDMIIRELLPDMVEEDI